jgi:hypothetical protein
MIGLGTRIRRNRIKILHCLLSISSLITLIILFVCLPKKQWIYLYIILVSVLIDLILVLIRFYFIYRWRRRLVTTITYNEIVLEPERLISNQNSNPFIVSIEMENYEYNKDQETGNFETNFSSHKCCCICKDDFKDKELISKLQCGHEYHEKCIGIWIYTKPQCPLCKKMLTTDIQEII